ncbi:MAG TPA: hypothetical protein VN376_10705 [Longilinea sp.]|nr:hypothetical protein [Longilinea sp.]
MYSYTRNPIPVGQRILAFVFAFLATLAITPSIFLYPVARTLFHAETYQYALQQQGVYDQIPVILAQSLIQGTGLAENTTVGSEVLPFFTEDDIRRMMEALIPPEWIETQVSSTMQQMESFWEYNQDVPTVMIDFLPLKQRMQGVEGRAIAEDLLRSLPQCSVEDLMALTGIINDGSGGTLPLCMPNEVLIPLTAPLLQSLLISTMNAFPDRVDLWSLIPAEDPSTGSPAIGQLFNQWMVTARSARSILLVLPWIALVLILLTGLALLPHFGTSMRWVGGTIIVSSLAALLVVGFLFIAVNQLLLLSLSVSLSTLPGGLGTMLIAVMQQIGNELVMWSGLAGLAAFLVGLVIFIIGRFLQPKTPVIA